MTKKIKPLYSKSTVEAPDWLSKIDGGCTAAKGFAATGIHAGFRKEPTRLDFALVLADEPVAAAATFTQNVFCAAPVIVSREHLDGVQYGQARAVIINSGNANAATGPIGLDNARLSTSIAADAIGCLPDEVLVSSTGVIGIHLPMDPFKSGVPVAMESLSSDLEGGHLAARAIMTTDTVPKECAYAFTVDDPAYEGVTFTVGGMSKGSGMIMPNMATMISVITTDAPVAAIDLRAALSGAVKDSFNKITVDSDTSTNDSCFLMASGKAAPGASAIEPGSSAFERFTTALNAVCNDLARTMASDGEGATRLVTVRVTGAADDDDADKAARTIANSPLVKTAIYGHDCNWGRIAAAAGRSGAKFEQGKVAIDIMGLPVCRQGLTVEFDEDEALRRFENPEITIDIDLGAGTAKTRMWTCDFSHDYVTINGDYRT